MMPSDTRLVIITKLNNLLRESKNLHIISWEFYQLIEILKSESLSFKIVQTIEYYLDDELTFARNKYLQAFSDGDLETASIFKEREKLLLRQKAGTTASELRVEESLFEIRGSIITAHLGRTVRDRLIKNLINSYELKK